MLDKTHSQVNGAPVGLRCIDLLTHNDADDIYEHAMKEAHGMPPTPPPYHIRYSRCWQVWLHCCDHQL